MSDQADVIALRRWRPIFHLGTRLREVRIQWGNAIGQNLTQDQMADMLDVPRGSYKSWENTGKCAHPVELANRLYALIPRFDRAWFLDITDGPTSPDGGSVIAKYESPCTRSPRLALVALPVAA